jgi:hypothetical protein
LSSRSSQYNNRLLGKWGVKKRRLASRAPGRHTAAVDTTQTDDELDGVHRPCRGQLFHVAEESVHPLIFPWIEETDSPWCDLRFRHNQELHRPVQGASNNKPTSHTIQNSCMANVTLGSSPRSSTYSDWASFRDIHRQATDPQHETIVTLRPKQSPKKTLQTSSVTESFERRYQQSQRSIPSKKTLSSHGSERPSDLDLEFKNEDCFDSKWIDLDGTSINEDGKVGLSRRGMLGHF